MTRIVIAYSSILNLEIQRLIVVPHPVIDFCSDSDKRMVVTNAYQ